MARTFDNSREKEGQPPVDIECLGAETLNIAGISSPDWKTVCETPSNARNHLLRTMFYNASLLYEQELEALEMINRQEALKKISELFDIPTVELWYFIQYGEEQTESLFNALKNKDNENVDPFGSTGVSPS